MPPSWDPWGLYAVSICWSTMALAPIGYGGIVPVRFEEYFLRL